jgi:phosphoenolpyruvate synthase/pyruvate phosphate dikinase
LTFLDAERVRRDLLGGRYSTLASEGAAVPNGLAITADAYCNALLQPGIADEFHRLLDSLDKVTAIASA